MSRYASFIGVDKTSKKGKVDKNSRYASTIAALSKETLESNAQIAVESKDEESSVSFDAPSRYSEFFANKFHHSTTEDDECELVPKCAVSASVMELDKLGKFDMSLFLQRCNDMIDNHYAYRGFEEYRIFIIKPTSTRYPKGDEWCVFTYKKRNLYVAFTTTI